MSFQIFGMRMETWNRRQMPTSRVVTPDIAKTAKLFEQPDQRQPFSRRLALVCQQQPVKLGIPGLFRLRLRLSLVPKLRRLRSDDPENARTPHVYSLR